MAEETQSFFTKHWQAWKEYCAERFSIKSENQRPLPSSTSDGEAFDASDPVHDPACTEDEDEDLSSSSPNSLLTQPRESFGFFKSGNEATALNPVHGSAYTTEDEDLTNSSPKSVLTQPRESYTALSPFYGPAYIEDEGSESLLTQPRDSLSMSGSVDSLTPQRDGFSMSESVDSDQLLSLIGPETLRLTQDQIIRTSSTEMRHQGEVGDSSTVFSIDLESGVPSSIVIEGGDGNNFAIFCNKWSIFSALLVNLFNAEVVQMGNSLYHHTESHIMTVISNVSSALTIIQFAFYTVHFSADYITARRNIREDGWWLLGVGGFAGFLIIICSIRVNHVDYYNLIAAVLGVIMVQCEILVFCRDFE